MAGRNGGLRPGRGPPVGWHPVVGESVSELENSPSLGSYHCSFVLLAALPPLTSVASVSLPRAPSSRRRSAEGDGVGGQQVKLVAKQGVAGNLRVGGKYRGTGGFGPTAVEKDMGERAGPQDGGRPVHCRG